MLTVLQNIFIQHANPERAQQQAAYMKFKMPFYGITKPTIEQIMRTIYKPYAPQSAAEYQATLHEIFTHGRYREEWYAGLLYAKKHRRYITLATVPLYLQIVRMSQWWDIVDDVAVNLIGVALKGSDIRPLLQSWSKDSDMWVRRTALLTQLKYKQDTDVALLQELILRVAHEKDFFIRKAIGWVLREYSKTDPEAVLQFVTTHKERLSALSIKEGLRCIKGISTTRG